VAAGVEGEESGAEEEDGDEAKEHGEVGPALVQGGPDAVLDEVGNLGGGDGGADDGQQRDASPNGVDSEQDQHSADDLDSADEWCGEAGGGDSDFGEAGDTKGPGKIQLLNAFGEEDPADKDAEKKKSDGLVSHELLPAKLYQEAIGGRQ